MKVLFYSPLAILSYHFETDLELIRLHQDKGDDVYVLGCNGELKKVGYHGCEGVLRCMSCSSKFSEGMNLLGLNENNFEIIKLDKDNKKQWTYKTKQELMSISYKGVDIGACVLSTLISNLREPVPDLKFYKVKINFMLSRACELTDKTEEILKRINPDVVYLFNGRFSIYRPVLRLCQNYGIKCFVHERGGKLDRYALTENTYPHDLEFMKKEIKKFWNESGLSDQSKFEIGSGWFDERCDGVSQAWFSFTSSQRTGMLPLNFDKNKRNFTIYVSSEDEFSALDGWDHPLFTSQIEGINYIINNTRDSSIHYYIRIHPNLAGIHNSQTAQLMSLYHPFITIIEASSIVNSYALMHESEKVITFGSTIGAEAVYAGKPSVLLGRALYEDCPSLIIPRSKEELMKFINEFLVTPEKKDILKFGYWASEFGQKFTSFRPVNLSNGTFLGSNIRGNVFLYYASSFFTFCNNFKQVIKGQMSLRYLYNRVKNKVF